MTIRRARSLLAKHGQEQILDFWDRLDKPARASLLKQIAALNFDDVTQMRDLLNQTQEAGVKRQPMEPAHVNDPVGEARDSARFRGIQALRDGVVGVLLVAGGQGSRLGFEGPKGVYPVGPLSHAPLFYFHARKVLALERRWKTRVPFYIMTSPSNDAETRAFFKVNDYFGLNPDRVIFFSQAMWPALDPEGRIILDAPDHIFLSPDGHGGTLTALDRQGCLEDMRQRGLTTIFYFQVDNPLVDIAAPAFIGHHLRECSDFSLKVCAKRDANEGLGVVVERDGKIQIVEYTELTTRQKRETTSDGELLYLYGSVAIHIFSVNFLTRLADVGLPLHIAHKRVPYCDADGKTVNPDKPNAYKFEKFIFDAMAEARSCTCLAFERSEEFSPIKNASGDDSPATSRRDLSTKWARWLIYAGVEVPLDEEGYAVNRIEIDPCYALDAAALRQRLEEEKPAIDPAADILLTDS